ncbi:Hypothetical protein R9X50_00297300 [Acrodontium crateriforme]|uniref:RNA ligase/cyclic nucleotide phosphodiesterase n=1 Tax=Acrodontium crateriforme TaxID=150365 RepID=A0AAQ3R9I3_9PEZI|nr:Hypothetical protein R9X50_00297300 [Acrodontium crateriforme]
MAAFYTFEDLSGYKDPTTANPYDSLIEACNNDPAQIQARYDTHRINRNAQQKAKLLASDFAGVTIDEILAKLEDPARNPGFEDWRNCLVFWARPPKVVRELIAEIQRKLIDVAPNLWIMPSTNLHMTALEVAHSLTEQEIKDLVDKLTPKSPEITEYTNDHRVRLIKPLVSYDAQALALSFLPAVNELDNTQKSAEADYTYHHLRRDLYTQAEQAGVKVASRYVIPSSHLTIGRFITKQDFETSDGKTDASKIQSLVERIEEINTWLKEEYWPSGNGIKDGGEWAVGEETGLDFRKGRLWYGGGETVRLGKGF